MSFQRNMIRFFRNHLSKAEIVHGALVRNNAILSIMVYLNEPLCGKISLPSCSKCVFRDWLAQMASPSFYSTN